MKKHICPGCNKIYECEIEEDCERAYIYPCYKCVNKQLSEELEYGK